MFGKKVEGPMKMGDWLAEEYLSGEKNVDRAVRLAKMDDVVQKADKYIKDWRLHFTTNHPKKSTVKDMCTTKDGYTYTLDHTQFAVACMLYTDYYEAWCARNKQKTKN